MRPFRMVFLACCISAVLGLTSGAFSEEAKEPLRKIGGFLCVDLKPYKNDTTFDLYQIGWRSYSAFSQDIWKRHGVPYWYRREAGNIAVVGERWTPPARTVFSAAEDEGVARADHQQPGNGAISNANDDNLGTYWYAGDKRPHGKLWIDFPAVEPVSSIRLLGWGTGRHAPKDYRIGVILPDGTQQEITSVKDEKRMGQWISFDAKDVKAKGIYLDVTSTIENEHGPVIYEFQARSAKPRPRKPKKQAPTEVMIPLGGAGAKELFLLGNVGRGFQSQPKVGQAVGQYVVTYENGDEEVIPLVAGRNVADVRYGHFVPEAEPAFMLRDSYSPEAKAALSYHLDEMLPVEPKKQLLMFGHQLAHPGQPLKCITLRVTDAEVVLYLAAVTLRQSGPRMNVLFYQGKMIKPFPDDTPKAAPSILDTLRDTNKELSLDGKWLSKKDPGNQGTRARFFDVDSDVSSWQPMPVPSQWYVQGLDYHGVMWFRRDFEVPANFPGSVAELCFGGVDYDARVWLNGHYVGRHVGAYSSFKLNATAALNKGGKNTIVARVDSPIDPGFTGLKTLAKGNAMEDIAMAYNEEGCMGGIFRPVRLRGRGDVGIEEVWTQSTITKDLNHADVKVQFALCPKTLQPEELTIRCALKQPDGAKTHSVELKRTISTRSKTPVEFVLGIDDPQLWYPWEQGTPYLYNMEIEVWRGNRLLDRQVSRVGIRQVDFDQKTLCLSVNHHRMFLKGFLNDDVHWMSLMNRTGYKQRLQMQKDANVNIIRIVTHQSSPEMYDLCNEMGMLVWQEMPLQWGYSTSAPIHEDIRDIARETVVQCRPHPCVVGYSAWNEGGQQVFTGELVSLMQELDSTRPMSRASGGGDWDVHFYTNLGSNLSRLTPLWSGVTFSFVSEVGSYGLPSPEDMHSILGPDLFRFDSADYYWDSFNHYRHVDGPLYLDSPRAGDWSTEKIRQYVLKKQPASERWLHHYMQFMFENFRGQRFAPTTAIIHCRFDDPVPSSQLGIVSFNGRPRKAYYATKRALQQVLPILFFDCTGAEDLRVVNDYWHRSWTGCTLRYTLKNRDGTTVKHIERKFDLPADATVKVLTREEVGPVWHLPGFFAELQVVAPDGAVLSENQYDMTADDVRAFVTNVYPPPPAKPVDAILLTSTDTASLTGATREVEAKDAYSKKLLELGAGGEECAVAYEIDIPGDGEYLIRVACNSGRVLRGFEVTIDHEKAQREHVPYLDMTQGITRRPYSAHGLSWRPGWRKVLSKGVHQLVLLRAESQQTAALVLDAICLQPAGK